MGFNSVSPAEAINFSEEGFRRGAPEAVINATEHPRILMVWPHGDETLGPQVAHHIATQRPELWQHVDYVCGNPIAARQQPEAVRDTGKISENYIVPGYGAPGTDLNRSFRPGHEPMSYEEVRAAQIMELIRTAGYDYVLDMHTTKSRADRCFIVPESALTNPATRRIISASRIGRVVVLPETVPHPTRPGETKSLVTDGLIGNVPNAVSIEYARPLARSIGTQEVMEIIDSLVSGQRTGLEDSAREVYRVTELIPKDTQLPDESNFLQVGTDGRSLWPVLCSGDYGKDPSKEYSGFYATSREVVHI